MSFYYLDIETTGLDPYKDKIIAITYQELDKEGNSVGDLIILKEWETSEFDICVDLASLFRNSHTWGFMPVMQNYLFDFRFIFNKFNKYKIKHFPENELDFLYSLPFIDIKHFLVIKNNLEFVGSGLDKMTNKEHSGSHIPKLYENREYGLIEEYIKQETGAFIQTWKLIIQQVQKMNLK
jgi:hypothetical protein